MNRLSFLPLNEETVNQMLAKNPENSDLLICYLQGFEEVASDGTEIYVALECGCLLVRAYTEDGYFFASPIKIDSDASFISALKLIRDYAVREMLPLRFTDVMSDDLVYYKTFFKFAELYVQECEPEWMYVRVANEIESAYDELTASYGVIEIKPIPDCDVAEFTRLCKDKEVNKYWGYDASQDNPDGDDDFYINVARREAELNIARALGIYMGGVFIGEGELYAFDYEGGASLAVRLLPEYQGAGLGADAVYAFIAYAREIGLRYLTADVMRENVPSIKMTSKIFDTVEEKGGTMHFRYEL